MADYTRVAAVTFTDELIQEGSWGERDLGEYESTMELYFRKDNTGFIEWDIPDLEMMEEIGLWFHIGVDGKRTLTDYDGVFSLPKQAVDLLRNAGVIVDKEYE